MKSLFVLILAYFIKTLIYQSQERITLNASMRISDKTFYVKETEVNNEYRIQISDKQKIYLTFVHETPSSEVRFLDITNDLIPEIIIDGCVACEGGQQLYIIRYSKAKNRFTKIKNTERFATEFYQIKNTSYLFDAFAHNRGGITSNLFKIQGDSTIAVAHMFLPYDEKTIKFYKINKNDLEAASLVYSLPQDRIPSIGMDLQLPYLWQKTYDIIGSKTFKKVLLERLKN